MTDALSLSAPALPIITLFVDIKGDEYNQPHALAPRRPHRCQRMWLSSRGTAMPS